MTTIPNGVYPTMVTPFTEDLQVDIPALAPLVRWYEERGVTGIFAICQSSEIFHLSFAERLQILREIMRVKRPGTVILASGHTAFDLPTQIEEAKAFIAEGIDAYVFISNRFAAKGEGDGALLRRMETVTAGLGSDIPLGVYECPYPYKRLLTPGMLRSMGGFGNFAFLKDTCCSLDEIGEKIEAVKGTRFKIFNANAAMLLDSLKLGAAGFSGVMANFHPRLYVRLCQCWREQPELARRLQNFLGMASMAELQLYPGNAKRTIAMDGVPIGPHTRAKDDTKHPPFDQWRLNDQFQIEQMREMAQMIEREWLA